VAAEEGRSAQLPPHVEWVDGELASARRMGDESTTAQVHPRKLTETLVASALRRGARLVRGAVSAVSHEGGRVTGVYVDGGELIPAKIVILAMGPWTSRIDLGVPLPAISAQRYHSTVLRPRAGGPAVTADALFTRIPAAGAPGGVLEPEVYPRPDGEVYVCGLPDSVLLPATAGAVVPDGATCAQLQALASKVASCLGDAEVVAQQACYLPTTTDGNSPAIGHHPSVDGLILAAGHSCWGILNAPATGLVVSELVVHGTAKSLDIGALAPARLM
jgi:glycine/D-amino acid oxidase-like deaminating enzyme